MDWIHHKLRTKGSFEEMIRFATEFRQYGHPVKSWEEASFYIHSIEIITQRKGEGIVKMEIAFEYKWEIIDLEHPFFQKFCLPPTGIPAEMEFYETGRDIGWIQFVPGKEPIVRELLPGHSHNPEDWKFEVLFPGIPSLFIESTWTAL